MDKEEFVNHFAVTFLATWCANNYESACLNGKQASLSKPPVEDAYQLAEDAWQEKERVGA